MSEFDDPEAPHPEDAAPQGRRLRGFARRLTNIRDLSADARELVDTVLESSDRAKTEMVRMVAREVRNYLEELKLKDDLRSLIQGHSLEMHMSLSLKPLAPEQDAAPAAVPASDTDVPTHESAAATPDGGVSS